LPITAITRKSWRPWLGNKTPESVARWIAAPGNSVLVAVEGEKLLAVGMVTDSGEIALNYVSPDARFRGVSKALLAALEALALAHGNTEVTLTSTVTARRFYLSAGYAPYPVAPKATEDQALPMSKRLRQAP